MTTVFILGLRRSGTTVFWRWFRSDPAILAFDEPFSEQLLRLPQEHPKQIWAEYQRLIEADADGFWQRYAPIHRADELTPHLERRQIDYLQWLASRGESTVIDLTRCHLKLPSLVEHFPDARFIHLVRDPHALASSHLLPSRSDPRGRARQAWLRRSFWTRSDRYDGWGYQSLSGTGPTSAFGRKMADAGYDAERFYRSPAVVRLCVLWEYFGRCLARDGLALTGNRMVTVRFEEFAAKPAGVVQDACTAIDCRAPDPGPAPLVHPASPAYAREDARWRDVDRTVGQIVGREDWRLE